MYLFIEIIFFSFLFILPYQNKSYIVLVALHFASFIGSFFVSNYPIHDDSSTLFHTAYCCLNIFFIVKPWGLFNKPVLCVSNTSSYYIFKNSLKIVLLLNLILSLLSVLIIYSYFGDNIVAFKRDKEYKDIYESIPYFGYIFRWIYLTQMMGYLGIPICFHYLIHREKRNALIWLILSSSSLVQGIAYYSRAQIFTFVATYVLYYLFIHKGIGTDITGRVKRMLIRYIPIIIVFFLTITVVRFSAMSYYSDRIPKESFVQNPIIYSLVDYLSIGNVHGIDLLDNYSLDKQLYGEQMIFPLKQAMAFLKVINYDIKNGESMIEKSYNDGGLFRGYVAPMVYNFGYVLTIIINCLIYIFLKKKAIHNQCTVIELSFIIILLSIAASSIFYCNYAICLVPCIFIIIVKFISLLRR